MVSRCCCSPGLLMAKQSDDTIYIYIRGDCEYYAFSPCIYSSLFVYSIECVLLVLAARISLLEFSRSPLFFCIFFSLHLHCLHSHTDSHWFCMIHKKIETKKKTLSRSVRVLVSKFRVLTGY